MVDLVQKTFRECTIDDDESHSQGSRASLTCDLLLAAFSKQIHSKTRIHTRGQSPGFLQGLSPENSLVEHAYALGDCPRDYGLIFNLRSTLNSRKNRNALKSLSLVDARRFLQSKGVLATEANN